MTLTGITWVSQPSDARPLALSVSPAISRGLAYSAIEDALGEEMADFWRMKRPSGSAFRRPKRTGDDWSWR